MQLEERGVHRRGIALLHGSHERRRGAPAVWRRRDRPRGGSGSRTLPPASSAAGRGRRRTKRSPGPWRRAGRVAGAPGLGRRAGRTASRPLLPTVTPAWSVPMWMPGRDAIGEEARHRRGGGPATAAAVRARPGGGRCRRPRNGPRSAGGGASARVLAGGTALRRPPGSARRGRLRALRAPRRHGPRCRARAPPRSPGWIRTPWPIASGVPRELPVTTTPRPRTEKTRSMASQARSG